MSATLPDPNRFAGMSGHMLVSMPQLDDGPFSQSVVLICRHNADHAFGVIVNKPIDGLLARDAIADIRLSPALTACSGAIFFGGPCDPRKGFVLHTADFRGQHTMRIPGGFALTATRDALERLHGDQLRPQTSRVLGGHAGWGPGQLDDEMRRNVWLDLPADPKLIFNTPPHEMWDRALEKIGVKAISLGGIDIDINPTSRTVH